ncbi:MAG: multiubiquitin domain-containing protein [Candidatus Berkelbacteria bacterium]|nr:multiubiquitin domain-containing protein [Candidatus Berkelbacteria bacterium]
MNESEKDKGHGHNKTYSIIVNGRPREVSDHKLGYLEVIELAYPGEKPTDTIVFTVTYSNPHGKDGTLVAGGKDVPIKDGMIFNVRKTDQS